MYLAVILDAWSRRVVGYAISRSIDARQVIAALKSAIRERDPPKGCIHHSDRGSQYASADYRKLLAAHGLVGSMSHRAKAFTLISKFRGNSNEIARIGSLFQRFGAASYDYRLFI